jgi:hypothetical protein
VAQHFGRLGEDQLHHARVLRGGGGELARPRRRRDGPQVHVAALRLRDRLLRDHQNVAVAEPQAHAVERRQDGERKVVARLDQRNAFQRKQLEAARAGHGARQVLPPGTPVMRMPAPSIL